MKRHFRLLTRSAAGLGICLHGRSLWILSSLMWRKQVELREVGMMAHACDHSALEV